MASFKHNPPDFEKSRMDQVHGGRREEGGGGGGGGGRREEEVGGRGEEEVGGGRGRGEGGGGKREGGGGREEGGGGGCRGPVCMASAVVGANSWQFKRWRVAAVLLLLRVESAKSSALTA